VHKLVVGQSGASRLVMEVIYTYITHSAAAGGQVTHNEGIALQSGVLIYNLALKCDDNRQNFLTFNAARVLELVLGDRQLSHNTRQVVKQALVVVQHSSFTT